MIPPAAPRLPPAPTPGLAPSMAGMLMAWQRLCAAQRAGLVPRLLPGAQLGLVGHRGGAPRTRELVRAATELGAKVSLLAEPALLVPQAPGAPAAARLLGRLYGALDGDGLDADVLAWLEVQSGLPVTSLVTPRSPGRLALDGFAALAPGLPAASPARRIVVLQVGLLVSLGERRGN